MMGIFGFFGGCSMVSVVVVLALVPETKGQSLEQLQRRMHRPRHSSTIQMGDGRLDGDSQNHGTGWNNGVRHKASKSTN